MEKIQHICSYCVGCEKFFSFKRIYSNAPIGKFCKKCYEVKKSLSRISQENTMEKIQHICSYCVGCEKFFSFKRIYSNAPIGKFCKKCYKVKKSLSRISQVAIVEPVAVEPVAVEPVAVKPVAVEPVAVEPVVDVKRRRHYSI
jgi:hypothetical protein